MPATSHVPSVQTLARHATVPTLNDICANLASPVPSVTVAYTSKSKDGSPERSAVGDASGVNSTLKTPFSSVSTVPSAMKLSSSPSSSPNQFHHAGYRVARLTRHSTFAFCTGSPEYVSALPSTVIGTPRVALSDASPNSTVSFGRLYSSTFTFFVVSPVLPLPRTTRALIWYLPVRRPVGTAKMHLSEPHLFVFKCFTSTSFPFGSVSVTWTLSSVSVRKSRV